MRLGLDFGTTNSAIALFDGEQLIPIEIDKFAENQNIIPSLIYIDKDHQTYSGLAAAMSYLAHETGRIVQWRRREIGQLSITVASQESEAPIQFYDTINVMVDIAAHGKLLQSIKTVLFNSNYEGTQIFDRFYRIEDLICIILKRLKTAAEAQLHQEIDSIVLGRPVRFSYQEIVNSRAEAILFKAAHLAGFNDVAFQLEPIGIVHLIHRNTKQRKKALIFDFGGGTLDLSIANIGGSEAPEILATHGVLVGGDDINRRIMQYLLPHFGDEYDNHLPPDIADKLLAWQTIPELSRPRMLERLNDLRRWRDNIEPLDRLETLVSNNLGFKLFEEIERVKKQLSLETQATIQFQYENIDIQQNISRRRLEKLMSEELEQVQQGLEEILRSANLKPSQIDLVVRTGGSSQIPLFINLLSEMFGAEKLEAIDPLVSVVGGFAITAYEYQPLEPIQPESLVSEAKQDAKSVNLLTARLETRVYTDHDFRIDRIPPCLNGATLIQASHFYEDSNADQVLHFNLKQAATMWVAYDDEDIGRIPDWLRAFIPEAMQLVIKHEFGTNTHFLHLYRKDSLAGKIILGGNQAEGYQGNRNMNYIVLISHS